jgi:nitric oxide reductase NorE protein
MTELTAPRTSEDLSATWTFILIECATFSAYFVIYMLYRMHDPETFGRSQLQLSPTYGVVNTLILLTSSWQVARSVHSARAARHDLAFKQAALTLGLGAVFIASKLSEWHRELSHGYTFGTDDFFAFYYFLTGIHIVHVLVGFIFMGVAMARLRSAEASVDSMETASIYWHMVDFLWVIIFALLYVVR